MVRKDVIREKILGLGADMNYGFGNLNVIDTEMSDGEDFEIYYEISKGEFQRIIVKR